MKKLFFFVCATGLMLVSCSDDDSSTAAETQFPVGISFKVNGVQKSFPDGAYQEIDNMIYIEGTDGGADYISFQLASGETGNAAEIWGYSQNNDSFWEESVDGQDYFITSDITHNEDGHLKGTFSGTMIHKENSVITETAVITNGTINVSY